MILKIESIYYMKKLSVFIVALLLFAPLFAQQKFESAIYDVKTKEKLPYVNLIWLGTKKGTSTDSLGNFSLPINNKAKKLVVSYVGYHNDTILVDKPMANVKLFLKENNTMLSPISINERKHSSFFSKMSVE